MIRYSKQVAQLTAIAAAVLAAPAFAATAVDANAEFDTGFQNHSNGVIQGGRIETNISGKGTNGDFFVAGRGTLILGASGSAGADDAWVQFGNSAVDVKLVRFEAADLWPTPGDVFRMSSLYTLNTLRGRATYAGPAGTNDRFHAAITANIAPGTSLEVGIVEKKDVSNGPAVGLAPAGSGGAKGIRPSVAFAAGPVSARLGFESGKVADGIAPSTATASFTGFGGWVSAGVAPDVTVRANFSSGKVKFAAGDLKTSAILLGVDVMGANISLETGKNKQGGVDTKNTDIFAAYAMPLFGVKGATFQPALGYQKLKVGSAATVNNTKVGFRVHYDF